VSLSKTSAETVPVGFALFFLPLNPSFFNPPRLGVRGLKGSWQQAYSTWASATA